MNIYDLYTSMLQEIEYKSTYYWKKTISRQPDMWGISYQKTNIHIGNFIILKKQFT